MRASPDVGGDLLPNDTDQQEIKSGLKPGQQVVTNALVLDLCCGAGRHSRALLKRCQNILILLWLILRKLLNDLKMLIVPSLILVNCLRHPGRIKKKILSAG